MQNLKAYKKAQSYLESLPSIQGYMTKRRHPAFYLERMRILLDLLDHPEKGFSYVHVTGTSGKGSVTMFLHNMLAASGKSVGSYLSPHTTTVVERILLNGKTTTVADFVWGVNKIKPAIDIMRKKGNQFAPSYFEALFAVSLLIFKKHRIRWIVLEVGCGGEFDATNTIPAPRVAVITNVHLDHMHLLGKTRAAIANTKAGILKRGTHCFTGEEDAKIRKRISKKATAVHVPMTFVKNPKTVFSILQNTMTWRDPSIGMLHSHVLGEHQLHNAVLAIAVAKFLRLPKNAIRKGVAVMRIPCRSEILQQNPTVMLDGAHNPAKISALVSLLEKMRWKKIHAVIGIGDNKPARHMLNLIAPRVSDVIFTSSHVDVPKPAHKQKLLRIWKSVSRKPATVALTPQAAISQLVKKTPSDELILITGSLYLTGEIRTHWIPEKRILERHNSF